MTVYAILVNYFAIRMGISAILCYNNNIARIQCM